MRFGNLCYNAQTTHLGIHSGPHPSLPPFWCEAKCGERKRNPLWFRVPSLNETDTELQTDLPELTQTGSLADNSTVMTLTRSHVTWIIYAWLSVLWALTILLCVDISTHKAQWFVMIYSYRSVLCTVSTWGNLSWFLCVCFGSTVQLMAICKHFVSNNTTDTGFTLYLMQWNRNLSAVSACPLLCVRNEHCFK